jgi:hypothetical protein
MDHKKSGSPQNTIEIEQDKSTFTLNIEKLKMSQQSGDQHKIPNHSHGKENLSTV